VIFELKWHRVLRWEWIVWSSFVFVTGQGEREEERRGGMFIREVGFVDFDVIWWIGLMAVQESASRWRDRRRIEGEVKGLGKREGRGRGKGETDGVLMRWRVDFQSM
jgi:hypothetical protein